MSDSPPIFLTKNTIVIRTKHMTTTDKLIATIIRALKVAVIKADSTTLIEQTYNPAIIAANELEAEIIRNLPPEPTQKQVDNAELEKVREALLGIQALKDEYQVDKSPDSYEQGEMAVANRVNTIACNALAILDKLLGKTIVEPQEYRQYCRTRNFALNEAQEIIRNHQPEPTQKQVDEKQLLDALEPKQIKIDIAYQGFYAFGAIDALHYLRPYLKQPTPADETLREFACVQVCKDLTRPYSGNPDDKTLDEIIADAKQALAQPSKPAVTPKDLEKVAEAIYTAGAKKGWYLDADVTRALAKAAIGAMEGN